MHVVLELIAKIWHMLPYDELSELDDKIQQYWKLNEIQANFRFVEQNIKAFYFLIQNVKIL